MTSTIRVRFVRYTDLSSLAIRFFTYGFWATHAEAILPDGRMVGAHFEGVVVKPPGWDDGCFSRELVLELDVKPATADRFHRFMLDQVGKPYDFSAVLSFVARRNWHSPDRWFCSELVAAALMKCGYLRPLAVEANRISPRDLLLILSGKVPAGTVTVKR